MFENITQIKKRLIALILFKRCDFIMLRKRSIKINPKAAKPLEIKGEKRCNIYMNFKLNKKLICDFTILLKDWFLVQFRVQNYLPFFY